MAETLKELNNLTDEELIERHNQAVKNSEFLDDFYLRVLNWRYQERHTTSIKRLTVVITIMTAVVLAATIIGVAFPI